MEVMNSVTGWVNKLIEAGLGLLALAVVLQVLFGSAVPFFPVDVVGNIVVLVEKLGSQGLVGLVAVWVLWGLLSNNKTGGATS